MNQLLAHVRFFQGEWIVEFSRGGADAANSFSRSEINAMPAFWEYLAGVASRCPVDAEFTKKSVTIELHQKSSGCDAWYIGMEAVA